MTGAHHKTGGRDGCSTLCLSICIHLVSQNVQRYCFSVESASRLIGKVCNKVQGSHDVMLCMQAFRGFAGTSILILVGVATDTARKFKAEQAMQRYGDVDRLYDDVQL